jgi:Taurine catabolism dioxygenase TauD, TfdA family
MFRDFTDQFLAKHQLHDSGNGSSSRVTNVYSGEHAIVYHSELAATPFRPDIIWFHCIKPALRHGETTICDGIDLLRHLDPETRELFLQYRLRFSCSLGPEMSKTILRIVANPTLRAELDRFRPNYDYQIDQGGNVTATYITTAVQTIHHKHTLAFANSLLPFSRLRAVTFEDCSAIPVRLVREIDVKSELLTVSIPWQQNDVAMIDNMRCMHGRRPFVGERVIHSVFGKSTFYVP